MVIWVWRFKWYAGVKACMQGRREGRRSRPPLDQQEHPHYEYEIKHYTENITRAIGERWAGLDRNLLGEYCAALREVAAAREAVSEAEQAAVEGRGTYEKCKGRVDESGGYWYLPRLAYYVLILVVGIIELPVNAVVFQVLGGTAEETYLYTLIPAVLLMLGAHFIGQSLKMEPARLGRFRWMPRLAVVFTALLLIFLVTVAYFRAEFIGQVAERLVGVKLNPLAVTVMFAVVNVLLVTVAAWLSFMAHDPVIEEMLRAHGQLRRAENALGEMRRRSEQAEQRFQWAQASRIQTYRQHQAIAEQFKNEAQRLMTIYRKCNENARTDGQPACFKKPLLEIQTYLPEHLDWECPGLPASARVAEREMTYVEERMDA